MSCGSRVRVCRLGPKAVEGYRSPRRFAIAGAVGKSARFLECASPLALLKSGRLVFMAAWSPFSTSPTAPLGHGADR